MGNPVLLVDNLFNTRMYQAHVVSAAENTADAPLVGAGRRSIYDAYSSATANLDAWLKARCGVPRYADMVAVERGHNQGGKTVKVQLSNDDFASTPEDVFNSITPSSPGTGSLDDALGVRTWEGAWLKRLPGRAGADWRYFVGAMGAGLKCIVPGLWIGMSWSPGAARLPFAPGLAELIVEEQESDQGWTGRGKATVRRQGILRFRFSTLFDAELAEQHLQQYRRGRPMWVIPDAERADDAFLAIMPKTSAGVEHPADGWMYPRLELPYRELDPAET